MPRELEKRSNAYQVNVDERDKLKRTYDENVALRVPNTVSAKAADDMDKVTIGLFSSRLSIMLLWIRSSSWPSSRSRSRRRTRQSMT